MLPVDNATRPVLPIEPASSLGKLGDARQEAFQRATHALLGKELQGEILSRLNDGTYLVKVAGVNARMMLPPGVQVGNTLFLTLVASEPKATFILGAGITRQANTNAALAGQQGIILAPETSLTDLYASIQNKLVPDPDLLPGNTGPATAQQSKVPVSGIDKALLTTPEQTTNNASVKDDSQPSFSPAGRLIGNLLYAAQQSGAATTLVGKVPLLNSPLMGSDQIATSLHETLTYSGLFYESHIVEWADGKRPLADLMREPQGALLAAKDNGPSDLPSATQADVAPELAQIINLQLSTLEHNRAQWSGEIWPGQRMEWAVHKDDQEEREAEPGEEATQSWNSSVHFDLPHLGSVSASIHLQGDRISIQVRTPSEQVAASLRRHSPKLSDALGAAGSTLDAFLVKHDSQA